MNQANQKKFAAFVRRYDIKGKLIASILNYHVSAIYQKLHFSYDVSKDDIDNLKLGYHKHLKELVKELEKELIREGYELN